MHALTQSILISHEMAKTLCTTSQKQLCHRVESVSMCVCVYSDFDRTVDSVLTSLSSLANSFSGSLCTQFNFFPLIHCRKHMSYVCTRFSGTRILPNERCSGIVR